MSHTVSARDLRAMRAGLLIAGPVLLYAFLIKPYLSVVGRLRDEVRRQYALMARERDAIASLPILNRGSRVTAIVTDFAATRTYSATDTALAMTAFDRDVTTSLQEAGLAVQRIEMRDSVSRRGALQELTIDVRAQGDFGAILDALVRLERNVHLINVSSVSIDASPSAGDSLSLVAVVHGYAK